MTLRRTSAIVSFILTAGLHAAIAAEADVPPAQAAVAQLQRALRADDRTWLAAHARYPVNYFGKRKFVVRNKAAFVAGYTSLIGKKLRAAVLAQDPADAFENWQGVMIGEGNYNIWIRDAGDGHDPRWQIVTINNGP